MIALSVCGDDTGKVRTATSAVRTSSVNRQRQPVDLPDANGTLNNDDDQEMHDIPERIQPLTLSTPVTAKPVKLQSNLC